MYPPVQLKRGYYSFLYFKPGYEVKMLAVHNKHADF